MCASLYEGVRQAKRLMVIRADMLKCVLGSRRHQHNTSAASKIADWAGTLRHSWDYRAGRG